MNWVLATSCRIYSGIQSNSVPLEADIVLLDFRPRYRSTGQASIRVRHIPVPLLRFRGNDELK